MQVGSSSTSLDAARVTHQPSATEATTATDNQHVFGPSFQDTAQSIAQPPASGITEASIPPDQQRDDYIASQVQTIEEQPSPAATHPSTISAAPHDVPPSLLSEAEKDRAQQLSSTVAQSSIAVFQPDEESMSKDSAQPPANHMQGQLKFLHLPGGSGNNQPSSTVTQASISADQPADYNSSRISARQPDSSHLLQSTEVQLPANMSASLNDQQDDNQPSSTLWLQSHEATEQLHKDAGSI